MLSLTVLFESCKLQGDQTLVKSTECSLNTSSFNVIKIISYLHTEFHMAYYLQKSSRSYKIVYIHCKNLLFCLNNTKSNLLPAYKLFLKCSSTT